MKSGAQTARLGNDLTKTADLLQKIKGVTLRVKQKKRERDATTLDGAYG